jgi:hypothetical protein
MGDETLAMSKSFSSFSELEISHPLQLSPINQLTFLMKMPPIEPN